VSRIVLHVIPSFAGGGAERQLVELATGLSSAGADVHLAHLHDGPNVAAARASGATLHRLVCSGNHDPRVLVSLRRLIANLRPAVVQTWLLHADVFGGLAARWCDVPWVLCERSSAAMYSQGFKFRLRRRLGLAADAIVANSEGGLQYWREAGFRGPSHVIRNITRSPGTAASDRRPSGTAPTLLAVGRLSEEKNYPLLFDVLETVFARLPAAEATVLGDGPERARLEARIAASKTLAGRVHLAGHVDDVADHLARAWAFVSLSRFEGTPNTVLEAIVQGCPLVVSDIPAHRELLTSDEARIVPLSDPTAIVEALMAALTDRAGACERADRARCHVAEWSMGRVTEQYLSVYDSLLARRVACASS
jgi:glycosyltransferase involved in cell wall biosynthesis